MKTALELIELERANQRNLGYDAEHDDEHIHGELAVAAMCYAHEAALSNNNHNFGDCSDQWPFEEEAWRPSEDPVRNLVKAGGLIVAEIERLLRAAALKFDAKGTPVIPDLAARYDDRDGTFDPENASAMAPATLEPESKKDAMAG